MNVLAVAHACIGDSCPSTKTEVPVFGGIGTSSWKVLLALHIIAVITAFGPTLLYPTVSRIARARSGAEGDAVASIGTMVNSRVSLPALIVAMLSGISLVLDSGGFFKFDQAWVSASFTVVILLVLLSWFVITPALRRIQASVVKGEEGREEMRAAKVSLAAATGMLHIGLIVLIVLMIWRPGAPGS